MFGSHDGHSESVCSSNLKISPHNAKILLSISYFNFRFELMCGIPSVTLEGEKSDWESLLTRLDKLDSFGEEPKAWAAMLRPILTRFVGAFDGKPDIDFWTRVCHYHSNGSGPTYLSGWITAFCVWSSKGKWQGPPITEPSEPSETVRLDEETSAPTSLSDRIKGFWSNRVPFMSKRFKTIRLLDGEMGPVLVLDKVSYPVINSNDVPVGFCEVDVKLDDNGEMLSCMMVSGHLATSVEGGKKDRIRPLPSWFMFVKGEEKASSVSRYACADSEE